MNSSMLLYSFMFSEMEELLAGGAGGSSLSPRKGVLCEAGFKMATEGQGEGYFRKGVHKRIL